MFTGLVESVGAVIARSQVGGGARLHIATSLARELALGDSLAVNGVCLTVTSVAPDGVTADLGPETLRVTTLGSIGVGDSVNLERPMRADARFGGHFVQGHVDAVGRIEEMRAEADFHWVTVAYPPHLAPFIVEKGSIAVDGISLTVATLGAERFGVQIVPFTMDHTTLGRMPAGAAVNLECDLIGKYVARQAELAGHAVNRIS
jgi:riboflavin synthase